jgi:hypothetical protein
MLREGMAQSLQNVKRKAQLKRPELKVVYADSEKDIIAYFLHVDSSFGVELGLSLFFSGKTQGV